MITIALALHLLATLIWVGGMFFAIMVLRLAAGELDPPIRVPLWGRVFQRFFPWVWMAVIILPLSGYWMIFSVWGGFAGLPLHVHIMQALGLTMILIYLHIWFAPYRRFRIALSNSDIPEAGKNLNQIRILVTVNLIIGLVTSIVGSTGRYW
ncbi:MAG: CopD family protein [Pseudomonadota bacterium]|nr:CopD family protein [Pseudomonadota bacterium]MEC8532216.1 CopD family protein [Pseudomonadota bacterium]MEC8726580.1 CopD family protein [Pseudomonadota bacterium]